jgi:hypothetical protein
MKNYFAILLILTTQITIAQELKCKVQVISPALQTSAADKIVFEELEKAIMEFVNNTKWTTETFKEEEKIECNFLINVDKQTGNEDFSGTIQITSNRPVFNTGYSSPLFNYLDEDFAFKYQRGTQIIFTPDQHRSNLSSVIAFYCYLIIAYDYDSFSLEGGTKYYLKAQQIANNAQSAPEPGWRPGENNRNRYWIIDNALQAAFKPLREAMYKYHRLGFDLMYNDVNTGRASVLEALEMVSAVAKDRIGAVNVRIFFLAKVNEIAELFHCATQDEKVKVFNICKSVDAGNLTKYNKIMQPCKN